MFSGKTLLITGGTGSFGNAVLDRFLATDVGEIRIFSRDEKKQDDMRHKYNSSRLKFYIGDVRDFDSIHSAMRGVDFVFSAAALKQVPSCEFYPVEAVKTNVLGTENTLKAAVQQGVKRVVVLSTDKAVHPINAMGMSKALMEKVTVAMSRNLSEEDTVMCNTRYGNVMASRGSVIPLFVRQIMNSEPITVTDPEMTRFMMSLPDSVDLVLFAFEHARQGDTFVQKAPAATILTLAEALKKIFNASNEIRILGTRHGEKKHECLVSREEKTRAEDMGNYYRINPDGRDLNYRKYFVEGEQLISMGEDYTSENTNRLDIDQMVELADESGVYQTGADGRQRCNRCLMKRKIMTIVGTRPEIIKLSRVIAELERHTDHVLVHTGQNFDYELNEIFFNEMGIRKPDYFLDAAGGSTAETIGNIIIKSDAVMEKVAPDAVLLYGDTNSCLSVISAKRRKIPVFHMEAGNRCFDQRVPEELNRKIVDHLSDINMTLTEHARRYLIREGLKPETIIKTGSSMLEVLNHHRPQIEASDVLDRLDLKTQEFFVVSAHREENVDSPRNFRGFPGYSEGDSRPLRAARHCLDASPHPQENGGARHRRTGQRISNL